MSQVTFSKTYKRNNVTKILKIRNFKWWTLILPVDFDLRDRKLWFTSAAVALSLALFFNFALRLYLCEVHRITNTILYKQDHQANGELPWGTTSYRKKCKPLRSSCNSHSSIYTLFTSIVTLLLFSLNTTLYHWSHSCFTISCFLFCATQNPPSDFQFLINTPPPKSVVPYAGDSKGNNAGLQLQPIDKGDKEVIKFCRLWQTSDKAEFCHCLVDTSQGVNKEVRTL